MHITTIALIISILGMSSSFFVIGIFPSLLAFILNIICIKDERSIRTVRPLAISFAGILLPIVMYLNSFGLSLPYEKPEELNMLSQIIYDNYSRLGLNCSFMLPVKAEEQEVYAATERTDGMYYVSDGVVVDDDGMIELEPAKDLDNVEESIDSLDEALDQGYGSEKQGASDDDMPSYGGLPLGVTIKGQYFREDYHYCNPIIVLKNETGRDCRFECSFIARDGDGNELAVSDKTVEVVSEGGFFVLEGRFDKSELGGTLPSMYEFLVSKRDPYEENMYDDVAVYGEVVDNSVLVTAINNGDKKAKVDAYVLFFDGQELVDCIWMIPKNSGEVSIEPGSSAYIKGDAYYRFDRIETYYTAYMAVGE